VFWVRLPAVVESFYSRRLFSDVPFFPHTALIYNGINSTIDVYRGHVHDVYGSMTAAALTGLVWRSTGASTPFTRSLLLH
jgi:hypothetical protein